MKTMRKWICVLLSLLLIVSLFPAAVAEGECKHEMAYNEEIPPTCTCIGQKAFYSCSKCGRSFWDADGADEIDWATDNVYLDPTPEKHGTITYYRTYGGDQHYLACKICGGDARDISRGEGNWEPCIYGEWTVETAPDEAQSGTKVRFCTLCGSKETKEYSYAEYQEDNKHKHKAEPVAEIAASCTAKGTKAHYVCACGAIFSDAMATKAVTEADLLIPETAHVESDWIIDKAAAVGQAGSKHTECSICHTAMQTKSIPALIEIKGESEADLDGKDTETPELEEKEKKGVVIEISGEEMESFYEDAKTGKTIFLDASAKDITWAEISYAIFEAAAESKTENAVRIKIGENTITMNREMAAFLTSGTEKGTVSLSIDKEGEHNEKQIAVISEDMDVLDVNIRVGEKAIEGEIDGRIKVTIPASEKTKREEGRQLAAQLLDKDGSRTEIPAEYDEDGNVVLTLTHLSSYVIFTREAESIESNPEEAEEKIQNPDKGIMLSGQEEETPPKTGDEANLIVWVILAIIGVAVITVGIVLAVKRKKDAQF